MRRDLLTIDDLARAELDDLLDHAQSLIAEDGAPTTSASLSGKRIAFLFLEDSTRTRVSFEVAATNVGATVLTFAAGSSSLSKGESLRDTVQTIDAMGMDGLVVRHRAVGAPEMVARWAGAPVVNAGDGARSHPTQALLDCLTLRQALGRRDFAGVRIGFVGDFAHSRVVRSGIVAFAKLGASVSVIAPPTLLPPDLSSWDVDVHHDLDAVLHDLDVVYTIRPQAERIAEALLPSMGEYVARYGLTNERAARLAASTWIMEAGPLVRGVQMAAEVADHPRNLMLRQVANGVPVRMAVLESVMARPRSRAAREVWSVRPATAGRTDHTSIDVEAGR